MMKCPNCGRNTKGSFCEWCGHPLSRAWWQRIFSGNKRSEEPDEQGGDAKRTREAEKHAKEKARLAQKEAARKEAEEVKQKARRAAEDAKRAKEAEVQAKKEAEERRKQEAKEAQLAAEAQAKQKAEDAKRTREAEKQAKEKARLAQKEAARKKAKEAKQKARREPELYEGMTKLAIASPVDYEQVRKLEESLHQIQGLRVVSIVGSFEEGTNIIISVGEPIPLVTILRDIPLVEQVLEADKDIQVTLRAAE